MTSNGEDRKSKQGGDPPDNVQWMLVGTYGEPTGPYSTPEIIKLIQQGRIQGTEKIRKLPDGKWLQISTEPDFYDRLISALEESMSDTEVGQKFLSKDEIQPQDRPLEQIVLPTENESEVPKKSADSTDASDAVTNPPAFVPFKREAKRDTKHSDRPVLELVRNQNKKSKRKVPLVVPLVMLSLAAVLLLIATKYLGNPEKTRLPHLVAPRITSIESRSATQTSKTGIAKAVSLYLEDSYSTTLKAQNVLVGVIESDPTNLEARGLLCLIYRELWPFVQQDSQDFETVTSVARSTRQLDPIGINGIYCEVSKLMVFGKNKEAKGVLDQALNQPTLSSAPVLYSLKAELIAWERDYATAALYADKAHKLWPEWVKTGFDYADNLVRSGRTSQGLNALDEVLRSHPNHKKTLLSKGALLYRNYQQTDKALNILAAVIASHEKVENRYLLPAYTALAQIYSEHRDHKNALRYGELALVLNPSDSVIKDLVVKLGGSGRINKSHSQASELVYLGDQYERNGDCLAAQAEYKAAFELDPSNGVAAMKAAKCLWNLNQTQEAIAHLNKAVTADRKLAAAYVLLADYYSQKYNYVAAAQTLTKAAQMLPNNYEILRGYGLVEFRRNNLKEAMAYLLRAQKIFENDIETLILLAKVYAGQNQFKEASIYASRAVELDSTDSSAQIVFAKIVAQLYGVDQGVSRLKELILKYSYTLEFRLGLADLYRESERYKQAQTTLEQLTEADPKNKKAWLGLGESYQGQGLSDKAIRAYLSAAILDPTDAEALTKTGIVYLERDKFKEAIVQFQRALKVNPLYPRLNYYIGKAYFLNGDYNYALTAAQDERKINPNLAESYLLAGEIYTETKQFQKCAEEYQQAIKLRPQGADLYIKLARCYRQAGSPDIAESMLNVASNLESGNPDIYKEQGAIYETRGDNRSAVAAYNKYLALSPNAPDRREVEGRINRLGGN